MIVYPVVIEVDFVRWTSDIGETLRRFRTFATGTLDVAWLLQGSDRSDASV